MCIRDSIGVEYGRATVGTDDLGLHVAAEAGEDLACPETTLALALRTVAKRFLEVGRQLAVSLLPNFHADLVGLLLNLGPELLLRGSELAWSPDRADGILGWFVGIHWLVLHRRCRFEDPRIRNSEDGSDQFQSCWCLYTHRFSSMLNFPGAPCRPETLIVAADTTSRSTAETPANLSASHRTP